MPYVNIGLGQHWFSNGLVPDGTKPLPEPMMTYHQWGTVTITGGQFHKIPPSSMTKFSLKITCIEFKLTRSWLWPLGLDCSFSKQCNATCMVSGTLFIVNSWWWPMAWYQFDITTSATTMLTCFHWYQVRSASALHGPILKTKFCVKHYLSIESDAKFSVTA